MNEDAKEFSIARLGIKFINISRELRKLTLGTTETE